MTPSAVGQPRPEVLKAGLVLGGVCLLTAGAWLTVPFYPVPVTMQTLAVLIIGGLFGARLGATSVAAYLVLGLAGAPVFHGGLGGPAVILGPTGGYLIGFLPAVIIMGWVHQRVTKGGSPSVRNIALLVGGAIGASVAIYTAGLPWLGLFTGNDLAQTLRLGAIPFLLGDLLKVAVAVSFFASWGRRASRAKRVKDGA